MLQSMLIQMYLIQINGSVLCRNPQALFVGNWFANGGDTSSLFQVLSKIFVYRIKQIMWYSVTDVSFWEIKKSPLTRAQGVVHAKVWLIKSLGNPSDALHSWALVRGENSQDSIFVFNPTWAITFEICMQCSEWGNQIFLFDWRHFYYIVAVIQKAISKTELSLYIQAQWDWQAKKQVFSKLFEANTAVQQIQIWIGFSLLNDNVCLRFSLLCVKCTTAFIIAYRGYLQNGINFHLAGEATLNINESFVYSQGRCSIKWVTLILNFTSDNVMFRLYCGLYSRNGNPTEFPFQLFSRKYNPK